MDYLNYFDKNKAVKYVVAEAKRQKMPITRLCNGIMDSSNFMKIVKGIGNREMRIENLLKMAEKLKIAETEFMKAGLPDSVALYNEIIEIKRYNDRSDYKGLEKSLKKFVKTNGNSDNPGIKQLILWLQGVCLAMNHEKYEESLDMFVKAMECTYKDFAYPLPKLFLDEHEIDVYDSYLFVKGYYLNEPGVVDEYERVMSVVETKLYEPEIYVRLCHSYALLLCKEGDYKNSLRILKEGFVKSLETNCVIMLPQYTQLYASLQKEIGNKELAEKLQERADILAECFSAANEEFRVNRRIEFDE